MAAKVALTFVVLFGALCFINYTNGAPAANMQPMGEQHFLSDKFAQFLKEDKEAAAALANFMENEDMQIRQKRDANPEDMDDMGNQTNPENPNEKPGFFDRAAKFVVELLQRFLRWINTDAN